MNDPDRYYLFLGIKDYVDLTEYLKDYYSLSITGQEVIFK